MKTRRDEQKAGRQGPMILNDKKDGRHSSWVGVRQAIPSTSTGIPGHGTPRELDLRIKFTIVASQRIPQCSRAVVAVGLLIPETALLTFSPSSETSSIWSTLERLVLGWPVH